jgi:hypothetical protein
MYQVPLGRSTFLSRDATSGNDTDGTCNSDSLS